LQQHRFGVLHGRLIVAKLAEKDSYLFYFFLIGAFWKQDLELFTPMFRDARRCPRG
jgi:hypothetical protein